MSGVLDLFGDDPDAEKVPGLPFVVYAHTLNPHADGRGVHQWTHLGTVESLPKAETLAGTHPSHAVVYQGGQMVFSNQKAPIPD